MTLPWLELGHQAFAVSVGRKQMLPYQAWDTSSSYSESN